MNSNLNTGLMCFLFISLFLSCDKNDDENEKDYLYPQYILAGQNSGDGIKYVNFDPDRHYTCDCHGITSEWTIDSTRFDINKDKSDDFLLITKMSPSEIQSFVTLSAEIKPLKYCSVCVLRSDNYCVDTLNINDTISLKNNWSDSTALLYYYYHRYFTQNGPYTEINGFWYDNTRYFVGIRIQKGEKDFFGWLDLTTYYFRQYAITIPYISKKTFSNN
jgi:hypothetical protein